MDKSRDGMSIIDEGLAVEGKITVRGNLVIKGEVQGTIEGDSVVIAKEGRVAATVRVASITIAGSFDGDVTVDGDFVLLASGSCTGKVRCGTLTVEKGSLLNAEISTANTEKFS